MKHFLKWPIVFILKVDELESMSLEEIDRIISLLRLAHTSWYRSNIFFKKFYMFIYRLYSCLQSYLSMWQEQYCVWIKLSMRKSNSVSYNYMLRSFNYRTPDEQKLLIRNKDIADFNASCDRYYWDDSWRERITLKELEDISQLIIDNPHGSQTSDKEILRWWDTQSVRRIDFI